MVGKFRTPSGPEGGVDAEGHTADCYFGPR